MKIVFTGSTSFLGLSVIKKLINDSSNVIYCLVRSESKNIDKLPKVPNLKVVSCDLKKIDDIDWKFGDIDCLVHFAWFGVGGAGRSNPDIQKSNLIMSTKLLSFANNHNSKYFIFAGSQAEYGNISQIKTEDSVCHPISEYGKAKLEFYKIASDKSDKMVYIHLRIFSVYGFGDHEHSLCNTALKKLKYNEEMKLGPCTQQWNYLYIDDFSNIIIKLIENLTSIKINQIINIASDDTRILREYIYQIKTELNSSSNIIFGEKNPNPEGLIDLNPSIVKLKKLIGDYEFTSFSDGIKLYMNNISYGD